MLNVRRSCGLLALVLVALSSRGVQASEWVRSWAAAPTDQASILALTKPLPIEDTTIRMTVRLSAGGDILRLRLSNELGQNPIELGNVHVALRSDGVIVPDSDRMVTFGGAQGTRIAAGGPVVSDPVMLATLPLAELVVSIHVRGPADAATVHLFANTNSDLLFGDQTADPAAESQGATPMHYILTGVDVAADDAPAPASIVVLGDSITDGAASGFGTSNRWTDRLAERLAQAGRSGVGIANQGISGGQLLSDGFGPSALARLDRDALSVPNVRILVVFLGINDIGMAGAAGQPLPDVQDLVAGYRQIIARAHDRGVLVIGATITPFAGFPAGYYSDAGDDVRQQVNDWIRQPGNFDGVIDFARIVAAPSDPDRLNPDFDSGDHLHPSAAGYRAMADAIDLSLFDVEPE